MNGNVSDTIVVFEESEQEFAREVRDMRIYKSIVEKLYFGVPLNPVEINFHIVITHRLSGIVYNLNWKLYDK